MLADRPALAGDVICNVQTVHHERFFLGVKDHRCMRRFILHDQTAQHVEDTIHRTGRRLRC